MSSSAQTDLADDENRGGAPSDGMNAPATSLMVVALSVALQGCAGASLAEPGPDGSARDGAPSASIDAGTDDAAATDAAATDASAKGIRVTVTRGGAPAAGVPVVLRDPDGKLADIVVLTDASGVAGVPVARSEVTVVDRPDDFMVRGGTSFVTYVAVEDGDDLVADLPRGYLSPPPSRILAVSMPSELTDASRYTIRASGGCGDSLTTFASSVNIQVNECARPQMAVVAFAENSSGELLATSFLKALTPPPTGSTGALALPPWIAPGTVLVDVTNLPAGTMRWTNLRHVVGDAGFSLSGWMPRTGSGSVAFPSAVGLADDYEASLALDGHEVIRRRSAAGVPLSLDASQILPVIESTTVVAPTPTSIGATWTSASTLAGTDGGLVSFNLVYNPGSESTRGGRWFFVVPPAATSLSASVLSSSLVGSPFTVVNHAIVFFESDVLTPRSFRQRPLPWISSTAALPARGTLRTTWKN